MEKLNLNEIAKYVEENIGTFHSRRIESLDELKLSEVLKKKNPYLFKAKNVLTAEQIIREIVDAFISSREEGMFGNFLEGLAIFICKQVYGGWKSSTNGIDLELDKDGIRYIISIKSGPNWGNKSQVEKLIHDFNTAKRTLRTSNSKLNVIAINGCCYGKDNRPDKKGIYFKYCGQRFWEFVSGSRELYLQLIEPLGHKAKEKNDEYIISYSKMINKFTFEFGNTFCKDDGSIDWEALVRFNSSMEKS